VSELDDMRAEWDELRQAIRMLDWEHLRDYYNRKRQLHGELIQTHHHIEACSEPSRPPFLVTAYDPNGASARVSLLAELDRLNAAYAPFTRERKILSQQARSLAAAITRTRAWERAHPQAELPLFGVQARVRRYGR